MRLTLAILAATFITAGGCRGYRTPFNTAPGTTQQQRFEAVAHDPYPQDDLGPEVTGGRPRDYQNPVAEPVRQDVLREKPLVPELIV
ncbi:MAG: membrane or secreted protein [Pirellulaceae bacterium]